MPEGRAQPRDVLGGLRRDVLRHAQGHHRRDGAKRYLPLIGTCAVFIFFSNALGADPGLRARRQRTSTSRSACGIVIFFATHYYGIKRTGVAYFKHFVGPFWWLASLMGPSRSSRIPSIRPGDAGPAPRDEHVPRSPPGRRVHESHRDPRRQSLSIHRYRRPASVPATAPAWTGVPVTESIIAHGLESLPTHENEPSCRPRTAFLHLAEDALRALTRARSLTSG